MYWIISSIFILLFGLFSLDQGIKLMRNGKKAKAIVYKIVQNGKHELPIVRFQTETKEWITESLKTNYSWPFGLHEGDEVSIIYDPEKPDNISIDSTYFNKIAPIACIIVGAVGFIWSFLAYLEVI